ncbi:biotin-dependent carboxyltransferase family protein [Abyssalbus ytuae]|uniref:Biotin-dependent carboxyltransferase family protein n=1 Tax=Abyssalbus ytuae TaxID=2926907 RepID=A0A9E7CT92_9FLAO|nr:biotin-dependent carboxyltransferase family protein [Abyssalbus ytuae]UOB17711.1 biotin-dependent carboxyltransferase family protein [Abyssalbus ytuae]
MIKVLKSGFYSTIQDLGRFGYRDKGVPVSGVMDEASAKLANMLLGNNTTDAVMEMTMKGPRLLFSCNTCIVITGAEMEPSINSLEIENNKIYDIHKGDILNFGNVTKGLRSYLAVKKGFLTELKLGSRSQYEMITYKSKVNNRDEINIEDFPFSKISGTHAKISSNWMNTEMLKVYKGPEFHLLSNKQKKQLANIEFTLAKENNRMACQLDEKIENHTHSILTSATLPGTVQLTPSGKLIILMKDAQTTGGYPRVLQLSEESICVLSQKITGQKVKISLID